MLFKMKFLAAVSPRRGPVLHAGRHNSSLCTSSPLSYSSSNKPALHELVYTYLKVHKRQLSWAKLELQRHEWLWVLGQVAIAL